MLKADEYSVYYSDGHSAMLVLINQTAEQALQFVAGTACPGRYIILLQDHTVTMEELADTANRVLG